jgi:hypothetical protein
MQINADTDILKRILMNINLGHHKTFTIQRLQKEKKYCQSLKKIERLWYVY